MFGEKKTEYRLITLPAEALSASVTAALGDGWALHGGPVVTAVDGELIASQAVVRTLTTDGIDL